MFLWVRLVWVDFDLTGFKCSQTIPASILLPYSTIETALPVLLYRTWCTNSRKPHVWGHLRSAATWQSMPNTNRRCWAQWAPYCVSELAHSKFKWQQCGAKQSVSYWGYKAILCWIILMDVCCAFGHDLICRLTLSRAKMDQSVCSRADRKCVTPLQAQNSGVNPKTSPESGPCRCLYFLSAVLNKYKQSRSCLVHFILLKLQYWSARHLLHRPFKTF